MTHTVTIEPRFNGPPDSANGGYTCGLVAREIPGVAEVSLRAPPPLGRALRLHHDGGRVLLLDGDAIVADGAPGALYGEIPPPVSIDEARAAMAGSPFLVRPRPFLTCFVCGPDRAEGDGLHLFPGPLRGHQDLHAGTWIPDRSLADADGFVRSEVVWASLDCPTSGPVGSAPEPDGTLRPIVLARLGADIRAPVPVGVEHVVVAWRIAVDGRKRHAGSALYNAEGELLASARALWIELKPDRAEPVS